MKTIRMLFVYTLYTVVTILTSFLNLIYQFAEWIETED